MKYMLSTLLLTTAVVSFAEVPIFGYFWCRYTLENPTTPEVSEYKNYFSIERGYVRWKTKTVPVSFSATLDISQKSGATNQSDWSVRLKHAHADWTLPYISTFIPDTRLVIGMQKIYFGIVDLWNYELIEKTLEQVEKKMDSADLGIGLRGSIPGDHGEFSIQVFNGNGFTSVAETNINKALLGNIAIIPFPGIMLKASYWKAEAPYEPDSTTLIQVAQDRYVGILRLAYGPVKITGEYLRTMDYSAAGIGYSGVIQGECPYNIGILGRYDYFDPDTDIDDDGHKRMIGGINYAISDNLLSQLNYQIITYDDETQDASDKIMLQFKYSY